MGPQPRKVHILRSMEEEGVKVPVKDTSKETRAVVKVPSLLFDIELEDTVAEEHLDEDLQDTILQLKSLVHPRTTFEHQLIDQIQSAQRDASAEGVKLDAVLLAKKLHFPGHTFKIRTALGGGCAGNCLRQLRHFFLTCQNGTVQYIVDPCFREQFEIANPSTRYSTILSDFPKEVVISEDRVGTLVNLLSSEIKKSFQTSGTTLPPWRHSTSMLSKWRPRRSEDVVVQPNRHSHEIRRPQEYRVGRVTVPTLDAFDGQPSSASDIAKVMAENHSSGFRSLHSSTAKLVSSPIDTPNQSIKRGRNAHIGAGTYSSLLASKLRGVDVGRFPGNVYQHKGQA